MRVSRWMFAPIVIACGSNNAGGDGRDRAASADHAKATANAAPAAPGKAKLLLDSGLLAKPIDSATRHDDVPAVPNEPAPVQNGTPRPVVNAGGTATPPPVNPGGVAPGDNPAQPPDGGAAPSKPTDVPGNKPGGTATTPKDPASNQPKTGTQATNNSNGPFQYGRPGRGKAAGTSDTAHASGSNTIGTCDTCAAKRSGSAPRSGGASGQTDLRMLKAPTPASSGAAVPGALTAKAATKVDTTRRRPH